MIRLSLALTLPVVPNYLQATVRKDKDKPDIGNWTSLGLYLKREAGLCRLRSIRSVCHCWYIIRHSFFYSESYRGARVPYLEKWRWKWQLKWWKSLENLPTCLLIHVFMFSLTTSTSLLEECSLYSMCTILSEHIPWNLYTLRIDYTNNIHSKFHQDKILTNFMMTGTERCTVFTPVLGVLIVRMLRGASYQFYILLLFSILKHTLIH